MISLLDYGAGNVRSLRNAIHALGFSLDRDRASGRHPEGGAAHLPRRRRLRGRDGATAGTGLRRAAARVSRRGTSLSRDLHRPAGALRGQRRIPGRPRSRDHPGPDPPFRRGHARGPAHGMERRARRARLALVRDYAGEKLYFVHSYYADPTAENRDWHLAETDYGRSFLSAVERGRVAAVQFHPEKSGDAGLRLLRRFLAGDAQPLAATTPSIRPQPDASGQAHHRLSGRAHQRRRGPGRHQGRSVRRARGRRGPQSRQAGRAGAALLRGGRRRDHLPQHHRLPRFPARRPADARGPRADLRTGLRAAHHRRRDPCLSRCPGDGYSALDVADAYFRSGADKISIGSDAVEAVEGYLQRGTKDGSTAIEQIAGSTATRPSSSPSIRVASMSARPRRRHHTVETATPGPEGERYCWFQCTVKGGREGRDVDAVELARVCETLGAGEILLNSIDRDGTGAGFDLELVGRQSRRSVFR
jgi:imidazole glycerol-phosphate synthase